MKRYLMATTAAIALIASPAAFAQDSMSPSDNAPVFSNDHGYKDVAPVDGFYSADPNQVLATRFIGAYIYNGTGDDAETVGDVNDIIMTPDGRAVAVIAGVGGFLGLGEKEVAVSIDQLSWTTDVDGERILVGEFTKEQLEGAPEFDRDALTARSTADAGSMSENGMRKDGEMANAVDPMKNNTDHSMTTSATPKMEMVSASEAQLEASEIIGMSVTGANNERIGEVSEILINEGGKVEAFIIDVGGFLGINEKPVAVSMDELQFARVQGSDDWTTVQTGLTAEALEGQEAYTEDRYKADGNSVILIAPVE